MTDLILSEDSKQYQALASDYFQKEVASKNEALDHAGKIPLDLYKAAWELGLATTFIPEDFGGLGLSLWDCAAMAEEAGNASSGLATLFEGNAIATAPLIVAGTREQKESYLSQLTAEPNLASFIFSGSAKVGEKSHAPATVKVKGNQFEISGENLLAVNGENAVWYVVLAADEDNKSLTLFVLPRDTNGIECGAQINKLGRRCADISRINLKRVTVDESKIIGKIGDGSNVLLEATTISNAIIAAHATGIISGALLHSIKYAKERQTFGKPIASYQAVSFMLADMAKNAQAARLLTWKACWLYDQGKADHIEAKCAKVFAVDAAMAAATDAVQIFGGYGYSKEYPVERLMRDAKMMQLMNGTSFDLKCEIGEELLAAK